MDFNDEDICVTKNINKSGKKHNNTKQKVRNSNKKFSILRIIGGVYPKHKIAVAGHIRPTLSRARSVMFDVLKFEEGWTILDGFAGSGAVGLEALSRGASKAVFFDVNSKCTDCIKKNISNMPNVIGQGFVFKVNVFRPPLGQPANIVFLDPPYKDSKLLPDVMNKLHRFNWINDETIVITESSKFYNVQNDKYDLINEKRIASSIMKFWKLRTSCVN